MKVSELISEMTATISSNATDADYVRWINEVNDDVYSRVEEKYVSALIDTVSDQACYTLPNGIMFEQVEQVFVNDAIYPMKDLREPYVTGYYEDGDYLGLYPVPSSDTEDAIRIVYQDIPQHHILDRIEADSLKLPSQFKQIYTNYCFYKIFFDLRQEPGTAYNYGLLYEDALESYIMFRSSSLIKRGAHRRRKWEL